MKQQQKFYNQREIAEKLGISKATASRYLSRLDVSYSEKDRAKLYPETVLKQLKKQIKTNQNPHKTKAVPSTIQLLQAHIKELQEEVTTLKEQLKIKDEQIKTANRLADQAQQLNALDKKELPKPQESHQQKKKHWWQKKE